MAGIYVHFPFCSSKCIYCDFYSRAGLDPAGYAETLLREASARRDYLKGVPPATLYFGGGTPSAMPRGELLKVADGLRKIFDLSALDEFTVEVNPDDVSPGLIGELRQAGVSRVSMGVQSFCDRHLRWMKRRHTADEAVEAFSALRQAGFANLSFDLIFGFQGLTDEEWERSIGRAAALRPEHISCYQMMGRWASDDEESCRRQYLRLQERLASEGYRHYEISNWALPGCESRHNSAYWRREPYLGLGASAHSFDGERCRSWNAPDLALYMKGEGCGGETLSDAEVREERIMLGLRTADGVDAALLENNAACIRMVQAGNLAVEGGRVRIPQEKFFISDAIVSELF